VTADGGFAGGGERSLEDGTYRRAMAGGRKRLLVEGSDRRRRGEIAGGGDRSRVAVIDRGVEGSDHR
jgi:hypothetical protein